MEHYVGLDVSLKLTAICIVDQTGKIEREGMVVSNPEAIAAFIKSHAPHVARVGFETGATATWLWTELNKMGLPIICIDARHAKAALKMQINGALSHSCIRSRKKRLSRSFLSTLCIVMPVRPLA
jgi:transposase